MLLDNGNFNCRQTVIINVANHYAKNFNKRVALLVGAIEKECFSKIHRSGIDWIEPLSHQNISKESYMKDSKELIKEATIRLLNKIIH